MSFKAALKLGMTLTMRSNISTMTGLKTNKTNLGHWPHLLGENDMKNYTTPRNFADCTWVQGYGRAEPLWERVAGYALAFAIGVGMAALLVAWWSS
jgi:hypothetical protein